MSGSKTKYYVSSSCSPIFDHDKRVNQYEAAMLDYTANSPIEYSEYMKNYYNVSRLRNYRGYNKWCDNYGFTKLFGKVSSKFYGDVLLNNEELTRILDRVIPHTPAQKFTVYQSRLAFFSEDFYIKVLAYQQGKVDLVLQVTDADYTISYPENNVIRATFNKSGDIIEGTLPDFTSESRFIEVSFNLVEEIVIPPPPPDPTKPDQPQEPTIKIETTYGYYLYRENSGLVELDRLIQTNQIKGSQTFYAPIPLRTNTSWYKGDHAKQIGKTLQYLELFDLKKKPEEVYKELQKACTDGMKEGNIGDIDYITMLLGVSLNSLNKSDLRYIYEFFFNLHTNYAISQGLPPSEVFNPRSLTEGGDYLGSWGYNLLEQYVYSGFSDAYFTSFTIDNASSNLHLTYSWAGSQYFEANGQFKPGAKPGEYGVLIGHFETIDPYYYEYVDYSATLFCHQYSKNRWHFVMFIDLNQNNLIYHGKSINTTPLDSLEDAGSTQYVSHDFSSDSTGMYDEFIYYGGDFQYITSEGDFTSPFIVPLEENTFKEVGANNNLEIAYGSQFLLFNCWKKVKKKWYQRGFFSVFLSFAGVCIGMAIAPICPIIGTLVITYFGTTLVMTLAALLLELTLKMFQIMFGDRLGTQIYNFARSLVGLVCAIIGKIPVVGWIIAGAIMFSVTSGEAINNGESLWDAFVKGSVAGAMAAGSTYIGGVAGQAAEGAATSAGGTLAAHAGSIGAGIGGAISGAINGFGGTYIATGSFKSSLKQGLISGVAAGALSFAGAEFEDILKSNNLISSSGLSEEELALQHTTQDAKGMSLKDISEVLYVKIVENPMTYANLLKIGLDEANYHKMANIESDYKEFANKYASAMQTYYEITAKTTSLATAEFVCKLQSNIGRFLTIFPETCQSMSPDSFLHLATASGSELIKSSLGNIPSFVENKLTMDCFTPETLFYSATDYTLTWDI